MDVEHAIHYFWESSMRIIQNGANLANLSGMCHQGNVSETWTWQKCQSSALYSFYHVHLSILPFNSTFQFSKKRLPSSKRDYVKAFLMFFHFAIRISISNKNKSKPMQRRMKNRNYFTIRIIRIMSPRFSFDKQYPWSFDYTNHTNFPMRILYRRFDINTIFCKRNRFWEWL